MRRALSPADFDRKCRQLEERFLELSSGSARRSWDRNESAGGRAGSKHLCGMARDYTGRSKAMLERALRFAHSIGLWGLVHDAGSGLHLHVQGLAPGRLPATWVRDHGRACISRDVWEQWHARGWLEDPFDRWGVA